MTDSLDINHIRVGERHRKDFGDIGALADSIKNIGLLAPVVVDANNNLVAGHRRLEAVRKLGWPNVPVRRVRQINDAISALTAERDENTCRKDFTPSEAVALGMALEELERPQAEERMKAGVEQPGGESPQGLQKKGKTRDIVAPAVGMKPSRYAHAKTVVAAQDDPDPEVAATAKEATEDMDRTGKVETAYRKVRAARGEASANDRIRAAKEQHPVETPSRRSRAEIEQKIATYNRMAAEGYSSRQISEAIGVENIGAFRKRHELEQPAADASIGKTRKHDSNRIVEQTVIDLEGSAFALDLVRYEELDRSQFDYWVSSLTASIKSITTLRNQLKKELTQ